MGPNLWIFLPFVLSGSCLSQHTLNRAILKIAYQSSYFIPNNETGYPALAVDINDGNHFKRDKSCTHTKEEYKPWWVVDLEKNFYISSVRITNRGDCCRDRLSNFDILIGTHFDSSCPRSFKRIGRVHITNEADKQWEFKNVTTDDTIAGRYVMIRLREEGILTLCKVEAMGVHAAQEENIAFNKTAIQCSEFNDGTRGDAWKAVDGNDATRYKLDNTCSHTNSESNAWWEVDLGARYRIDEVRITNRIDCCPERLSNFTVTISDTSVATKLKDNQLDDTSLIAYVPHAVADGSTYTIVPGCSTHKGRYLLIRLKKSGYLTLCEVFVQGTRCS